MYKKETIAPNNFYDSTTLVFWTLALKHSPDTLFILQCKNFKLSFTFRLPEVYNRLQHVQQSTILNKTCCTTGCNTYRSLLYWTKLAVQQAATRTAVYYIEQNLHFIRLLMTRDTITEQEETVIF